MKNSLLTINTDRSNSSSTDSYESVTLDSTETSQNTNNTNNTNELSIIKKCILNKICIYICNHMYWLYICFFFGIVIILWLIVYAITKTSK